MSQIHLPSEWRVTNLETIGEVVTGKTPSKNNPEYFGGSIPFIKPRDVNDQGDITRTDERITDLGAATVPTIPAGSIVVTCIGNLGRCAITSELSATNQQINSVIPSSEINMSFIYYQLRTLKGWMQSESSATTVTIINKSKFSQAPIGLPSLAEQKVIADKLDTLLAQVETTKARLDRIPSILKTFRQSVLAAAVSGRLTEEWRENNEVSKESWVAKNIGELAQVATGKTPKRTIAEYWDDGDIPWLTSAATGATLTSESEQFVTKLAIKECTLKLFPIGTLLLAMYGEGKTRGQVTELQLEATCNQACAAILVDEKKVSKEFLKLRLQENYEETRKAAVGGAQPNLNLNKVREITVDLPSELEQTEIVRRVEELFAFADSIEQKTNAALERVNNLTQSILAKAFRGELTADWRAANPDLISGENSAEALLAKIQAEREKLALEKKAANKTRKKKA
jgi:type I restriction enzyme S subunit